MKIKTITFCQRLENGNLNTEDFEFNIEASEYDIDQKFEEWKKEQIKLDFTWFEK